jgi:CRP-like cAMP-binding protein
MSLFDYPTGASAQDVSPVIFENLTEDDWNALVEASQLLGFRRGETLIDEGDTDDAVYIIIDGEVEVLSRKGVVATISEGSAFGEIAFFDREPRTAAVRASREGRALTFGRAALEKLTRTRPDLAHRVVLELGRLLAIRNRKLIRLV